MLRYIIQNELPDKISVLLGNSGVLTAPPIQIASSSKQIFFRVGHIQLMRRLQYKDQQFVPFIPTKHFMIIFPSSVDAVNRQKLRGNAVEKMSLFLSGVLKIFNNNKYSIEDAAICSHSGVALLILKCFSLEDGLGAIEACLDVSQQTPEMRMSPTFIQCYPCDPPHSDIILSCYMKDFYFIPTCVLCADRLESSLTGFPQNTLTCSCASSGERCICLEASRCVVCQMLYQSQTRPNAKKQVKCQECKQSGDPWICLICGYVGCSRYQAMHAKEHCITTQHFFSINLLTQQIWDYDSDAFVHHVVMVFDFASGRTTRVRYPSRMDSLFENENFNDHADTLWQKKSVCAKYDTKLRASHTQYATVIKNELDVVRQVFETEIGNLALNTESEVQHIKKIGDNTDDSVSSSQEPSPKGFCLERTEQGQQQKQAQRQQRLVAQAYKFSPFITFQTLNPIIARVLDSQETALKIDFYLQGFSFDVCLHTKNGSQLEEQVREKETEIRSLLTKNILASTKVDALIEELQTTLSEIKLNLEAQKRVQSQLEVSDATDKIVIIEKEKKNTR